MSKKFIAQFAQVFIHYFSNKTRSTTKIFTSEPSKELDSKLGRLFGIIEINTPSKENSKIINHIIAGLEEVYYSFDSEITPQKAFESTLKKVNDDFVELLTKDNSYMVGTLNEYTIREKINFVIGVLHKNKLILTSLNNVGAFLIHRTNQDYKTYDIIQDEEESSNQEELRLFNNVVTGEVAASDHLLFCNNDFLNFISKERFTKTITSLPPSKAADYFKNSLLQHEGFNFAAIVVSLNAADDANLTVPKSLSSIDTLNKHESNTEKLLSPSLIPNLSKALKNALSNKKKHTQVEDEVEEEYEEHVEEYDAVITQEFDDEPEIEEHVVEVSSYQHAIVEDDEREVVVAPKKKKINVKRKYNEAVGNVTQFYRAKKAKMRMNITLQGFRNIIRLRINQMRLRLQKIPRLSKVLFSVFIVALILFGYSLFFVKEKNFKILQRNSMNEQIVKVSQTLDEAESKLIFGDKVEARRLISLVETDLSEIKVESSKDQEDMNNVTSRLNTIVAKLRNITLIKEPALLYTFSSEGGVVPFISSIAYVNDSVIAFDTVGKKNVSINTRSREASDISGSMNGNVINSNILDDAIITLTDANLFYKIANNTITPIPVTLQPDEIVTDFTFYNDRLYNLIPSKNQIYRHPQVGDGYGAGLTWIQESGVSLEGANSVGIDTRIWTAQESGQITKFFKGYKQAFSIKEVDPEVEHIDKMIKGADSDFIYILEKGKNRMLVLNDEGELITQYFSEELDNVTSFDVDEKGKALYLANGDRIYAVIMSHL